VLSLCFVAPTAWPVLAHGALATTDMAVTATRMLEAAGAKNIRPFTVLDRVPGYGIHEMGTARMGSDPATSVVDADCRSWDIRNLWICDGSVFPTSGGVNPSLTIQAIACRTADRIRQLAARGEL